MEYGASNYYSTARTKSMETKGKCLTPQRRVPEKLTIVQLVNKYLDFYGTPVSQESAIGPYTEPDEPSPQPVSF
jgi:hypothetical protein